jgi:DNA-binding response OmpR family regulator
MRTVLIIDDEHELCELLKDSLEQAGFYVSTAENGAQGIEEYQRHPFSVVITDIIMPEKEGLETILELRQLNKDVRIIAISGGGKSGRSDDILRHAKMLGADGIVAKPLVIKDLIALIHRLMPKESPSG